MSLESSHDKGKIAIIGSGLIGKSWAMLFISGGYKVSMYDVVGEQIDAALKDISQRLKFLEESGILRGNKKANEQFQMVTGSTNLKECLSGATHVQECVPELLAMKQSVFQQLDELADEETVLASSTSAIPCSKFTESLQSRGRCLVVHPVNPPYYMPLVELVPAPWTAPEVLQRTRNLIQEIGQSPVTLKKELPGFVQPRIQYAMIMACLKLIQDGVLDPEDVDKLVKDGLGLNYSFVGPLESLHLSHDKGISGFLESNGDWIGRVMNEVSGHPIPLDSKTSLLQTISSQQLQRTGMDQLADRRKWRDDRLAALSKLRTDLEMKKLMLDIDEQCNRLVTDM